MSSKTVQKVRSRFIFRQNLFFVPSSFFLHQVIYWIAMMNVFLKHEEKTWEILAITEGHKLRLSCSCSECYLYNTAIITGPDVKSSIELKKLNRTEHSRHLFLLVCNPFLIGLNHNWFSFKTLFSLSPFIQVLW